jgi:hypothetical protein
VAPTARTHGDEAGNRSLSPGEQLATHTAVRSRIAARRHAAHELERASLVLSSTTSTKRHSTRYLQRASIVLSSTTSTTRHSTCPFNVHPSCCPLQPAQHDTAHATFNVHPSCCPTTSTTHDTPRNATTNKATRKISCWEDDVSHFSIQSSILFYCNHDSILLSSILFYFVLFSPLLSSPLPSFFLLFSLHFFSFLFCFPSKHSPGEVVSRRALVARRGNKRDATSHNLQK